MKLLSDTIRHISMWICGIDSKNGSEKNVEYNSQSAWSKKYSMNTDKVLIRILDEFHTEKNLPLKFTNL